MLHNTNKHFQEAKVVNFDIIHRKVWGEKVPEELLRHYQALRGKRIAKYPVNFQKQIQSSAFRFDKKDLWFKRPTILKHFKNNYQL